MGADQAPASAPVAARCLADQRGLRLRGGGDRARRRPQGLLGRVPGRRGDRRGQRTPAATRGLAAAAVHARPRLRLRAADRRGGAVDRRRRVPGRDRGRVVRGRAARLVGDGRGLDRPGGARRHQRGRRLHPAGREGHRSPAGRRRPPHRRRGCSAWRSTGSPYPCCATRCATAAPRTWPAGSPRTAITWPNGSPTSPRRPARARPGSCSAPTRTSRRSGGWRRRPAR